MIRRRALASVATATAAVAGMAPLAGTAAAAGTPGYAPPPVLGKALPGTMTQLAGSAVPFASPEAAQALVAGHSPLTVQVWLKPQITAAEAYALSASTPGNRLFRHHLSPAAYTARFGPTAGQAGAVAAWLRSAGFTGIAADTGRNYVQATAPVFLIETALHIQVRYYTPPSWMAGGPRQLRANDRPVSVPTALAGSVLGITGLDNAAPTRTWTRPGSTRPPKASPMPTAPPLADDGPSFPCSAWYGQHYAQRLPQAFGTAQFPTEICGYSAGQLRAAYGYSPASAGDGQTVALVELGLVPSMFRTLQDYARANDITAPEPARYREMSIGRGSDCGTPFDVEEQMDVEAAYLMSPGATHLVVGGDSCNDGNYGLQGLFDADTAILNGDGRHPLATIVSNSWEGFSESQPASIGDIEHAYLVRAAAEGVGMYFSSGDSSGVLTPSSDPFATAVGGTTLGISRTGSRLFETGWSTGLSAASGSAWVPQGEYGAAGGGPSLLWAQPAYQSSVVPAALARAPGNRPGLVRAVPDIGADADPFTGMAVGTLTYDAGNGTGYSESAVAGTSLSTPLVAALIADAQQGAKKPFGFLNPVLYRLAGTEAVHDTLPLSGTTPNQYRAVACDFAACGGLTLAAFDDQNYRLLGYTGQVSRSGYDTMTGLGTPNAPAFIASLRTLEK